MPIHRYKGATWRKAPLGRVEPKTPTITQVGPGCPVDPRYQVDPATFAGGEFSRAGIGRYVAEASCCAARR